MQPLDNPVVSIVPDIECKSARHEKFCQSELMKIDAFLKEPHARAGDVGGSC